MKVQQSSAFARRVKKLHADEKKALDKAVKAVISSPTVGQMKTGDLAGVQVYKYKHKTREYLLAYRVNNEELLLTLIALGTHENFYRELKKYVVVITWIYTCR